MNDHERGAFLESLLKCSQECQDISLSKGFGSAKESRHPAILIALIHSELSEALEAFRKGNPPCDKGIDLNAAEEEFADVAIRLMQAALELKLNLGRAILMKMDYNRTREHRHGGRLF